MIKYHKCSMCGEVTNNFNDAVNHALSHVMVKRSYTAKGFYVCPLCNHCFDYENDLQDCMNQHLHKLKEMGYVITKGDYRE